MLNYKDFLNTKFAIGLNQGQLTFFREFLDSGRNLFVTGGAGTGKSFLLNRLSEFCEDQGLMLSKTSSTGVSAINIGAQTLHSFLGIGLGDGTAKSLIERVAKNKKARQRIQSCKVLFIDEISMVSGELFDKVLQVIKAYNWRVPQIIAVGDFLQLSPVFKNDRLFAFESKAWELLNFKSIYLTEILRQDKNSEFASVLNKIRLGKCKDFSLFAERFVSEPKIGSMVVFSKNVDVDHHNLLQLNKLQGKIKTYLSQDSGPVSLRESLDKNCLAPTNLDLKLGAQVMLLKNKLDQGISNGSVGKVVSLFDNSVEVEFDVGIIALKPENWNIEETYEDTSGKAKTRILASRTQIPLRLSYSATAHKVQGFTIDKITADLGSCFAAGQFYTCLSRAKTLEGLYIMNFNENSMKTDSRCIKFYEDLLLVGGN